MNASDPTSASALPVVGRWWRPCLVGLLVAWLSWPLATITPTNGLDESWQAALHLAHQRGIRFGSGLDFIYGPLGFLSGPRLWWRPTAALALAFQLAVGAGLGTVLYVLLRRHLPALLAIFVAVVVVRLTPEIASGELLVIVVLLCSLELLSHGAGPRPRAMLFLGTGVAAVEVLVKFDTGVISGGLVVITAAALAERAWRGAAAAVALIGVEVVVLALLAGQTLPDLLKWLRADVSLVSGYTAAMATEATTRAFEYVEAVVLVGAVVVLLVAGRWQARSRVGVVLALLWAGYLQAKHGFVRHDAHSIAFFLTVAVVPLALRVDRWRAAPLAVTAAGLCALALATAGGRALLVDPTGPPTAAVSQLADLVVPSRHDALVREARSGMARGLAIDESALAMLRGHTVQVDNYNTSAIWAHGLDWAPVPAFQLYVAYTAELDRRNVARLRSSSAPDRILRSRHVTIDGRFSPFDSPGYVLETLCRYRELRRTPNWQVLGRTTDRCGAPRALSTVQVEPDSTVAVPRPSAPDRVVYARVALPNPPLNRLATLLLKPLFTPGVRLDGLDYRLVPGTARQPLVLRVPEGAPVGPGPGGRLDISSIGLLHLPAAASVTFYEVPLAP